VGAANIIGFQQQRLSTWGVTQGFQCSSQNVLVVAVCCSHPEKGPSCQFSLAGCAQVRTRDTVSGRTKEQLCRYHTAKFAVSAAAAVYTQRGCIGFLSAVVFLLLVNWSVDLHSLASLKWCRKLALLLDFKPDVSVSLLLVAHTQTASYEASDLFTVSLHYGTLLYITSSTQKQKWEPHSGGNGRLIGFQCKSEGQAWCSHVCISLIR
jgi:hypothetical protein